MNCNISGYGLARAGMAENGAWPSGAYSSLCDHVYWNRAPQPRLNRFSSIVCTDRYVDSWKLPRTLNPVAIPGNTCANGRRGLTGVAAGSGVLMARFETMSRPSTPTNATVADICP